MTKYKIDYEIDRFTHLFTKKAKESINIEQIGEFAYMARPLNSGISPKGKDIALTLMAITHGNEVAGIAVLNDLIHLITQQPNLLEVPIAFVLGNPWAAKENRRFLERDLNRSFNRNSSATHEERRANVLEGILKNTSFFLDLHQTTEPCETPFFIFPYTPGSYSLARHTDERLPIVTHWGDPFSTEGQCSDEFTMSHGGIGITLELGQNGFGSYSIASGYRAALQCLIYVTNQISSRPTANLNYDPDLYTWGSIVPWPTGEVKLDEGWYNFKEVSKGARLGTVNNNELFADCSGKVLFPKYLRNPEPKKPTELIRIMRQINESELGKK